MPERLEILVEHADRVWRAEEENARRLHAKRNFALTQVGVLIGALVLRFGRLDDGSLIPEWLAWSRRVVSALISLMLVLAARSLLASSTPRLSRGAHASEHLPLPPAVTTAVLMPDAAAAWAGALRRLTTAGWRLSTLNLAAAFHIRRGQAYLSNAYFLALVYLLLG